MVCDLAISITKAKLADERLKALLTPAVVARVLTAALTERYPNRVHTTITGDRVTITLPEMTLYVRQNEVNVSSRGNRQAGKQLSEQLAARLTLTTDLLFTQLVEQMLQGLLTQQPERNVTVELQNRRETATVFPVHLADIAGRVFALAGGRVEIFIDQGSFEQAKAATVGILRLITARGLPLVQQGEVEQHRAGGPAHVHRIEQQKGQHHG